MNRFMQWLNKIWNPASPPNDPEPHDAATDSDDSLNWIEEIERCTGRESGLQHIDGIPWWEAPIPPRDHKCTSQTRGIITFPAMGERCACGAIRLNGDYWFDKNRRDDDSRKPRTPPIKFYQCNID